MKRKLYILLILIFLPIMSNAHDLDVMTIAGGSKGGVFIKVAKSLCTIVNRHYLSEGVLCKAKYTGGAKDNFQRITEKEVDFAIAKPFQVVVLKDRVSYKTITSLHNEYLTLLVRKDADIDNLKNLQTKKVSVGSKGSASNTIMQQFFKRQGYVIKNLYNYKILDAKKKICSGEIDAILYFIGHPNQTYAYLLKDCKVEIVSLPRSEIKKLTEFSDSFQEGEMLSSAYEGMFIDVDTVLARSVLIAKPDIKPRYVEIIQDIIYNHKDELLELEDIYKQIRFVDLYKYN